MLDMSPWLEPTAIIDAIFEARRGNRRDLLPQLELLLDHAEPMVREEVVSLLMTKWGVRSLRTRAREMIERDEDLGVRARAAIGLGSLAQAPTSAEDADYLAERIADRATPPEVRRACFEALTIMAGRPTLVELDDIDAAKVDALVKSIKEA